jgi:hypothetical protein
MNINTLRKKAKADTLEVEDILAAAKDRIPGLQAELQRLSIELQWSDTPFLADGTHVVPLAKWAAVAGAYAEGGMPALVAMNEHAEDGYYITALLQELTTDEANAALFDLYGGTMDNPADSPEFAFMIADTLNFKFAFKHSSPLSALQADQARSFLMKLYPMADTEPNRCKVVCALRGVGDQTTVDFLATINPFSGSYAGLEQSAQRAIRKRLRAASSKIA